MTYHEWMKLVDLMLLRQYGTDQEGSADWPSRDTFNANKSPTQAVKVWRRYQDGL